MGKSATALLRYHAERTAKLTTENRKLRAEAKVAHRTGYEDGAKATTLLTYLALSDFGTDGTAWISDRISAVIAGRKQPAPPSTEIENAVTHSVIANMRKYNPRRAAEIEKSFQDFLAGDSK